MQDGSYLLRCNSQFKFAVVFFLQVLVLKKESMAYSSLTFRFIRPVVSVGRRVLGVDSQLYFNLLYHDYYVSETSC